MSSFAFETSYYALHNVEPDTDSKEEEEELLTRGRQRGDAAEQRVSFLECKALPPASRFEFSLIALWLTTTEEKEKSEVTLPLFILVMTYFIVCLIKVPHGQVRD